MTVCTAMSAQGNVCAREAGHEGCHEVYVDGDGRRWWGDAREIRPREGWAHVGCPTCGMVTTVPLERSEPGPWCVHNGSGYSWRDPHPETQRRANAWTRMVRVTVMRSSGPDSDDEVRDGQEGT